jgi:hypothetical protein
MRTTTCRKPNNPAHCYQVMPERTRAAAASTPAAIRRLLKRAEADFKRRKAAGQTRFFNTMAFTYTKGGKTRVQKYCATNFGRIALMDSKGRAIAGGAFGALFN